MRRRNDDHLPSVSGSAVTGYDRPSKNYRFGNILGTAHFKLRGADRPTATLAKYQQHAALRGQWITDYYSAGNGIEPVAAIPWKQVHAP